MSINLGRGYKIKDRELYTDFTGLGYWVRLEGLEQFLFLISNYFTIENEYYVSTALRRVGGNIYPFFDINTHYYVEDDFTEALNAYRIATGRYPPRETVPSRFHRFLPNEQTTPPVSNERTPVRLPTPTGSNEAGFMEPKLFDFVKKPYSLILILIILIILFASWVLKK